MRIEEELKLDFQDVLIRPKRSTLGSRAEVDISREFVFRHSGRRYSGVPIIAANMDTVGTFEMARALARHRLATSLPPSRRRRRHRAPAPPWRSGNVEVLAPQGTT